MVPGWVLNSGRATETALLWARGSGCCGPPVVLAANSTAAQVITNLRSIDWVRVVLGLADDNPFAGKGESLVDRMRPAEERRARMEIAAHKLLNSIPEY